MCGAANQEAQGETREQVQAVLNQTAVSWEQLARWRREGILPPVYDLTPLAYRGSVVHYPAGTCAQINEIQRLLKEKNRIKDVAIRLWRDGYWVREDLWRSRLRNVAKLEPILRRFIRLKLSQDARDDLSPETFTDRLARRPSRDTILSRVFGRLLRTSNSSPAESSQPDLSVFYRVMADISQGQFAAFERPEDADLTDKDIVQRGLDFNHPDSNLINGMRMNHREVIEGALENVSQAFDHWSLVDAANAPACEIWTAYIDTRNILDIARDFYDATAWMWGEKSFGFRFAAWIARKANNSMLDGLTLIILLLRRIPGAMISSEEIAATANAARQAKYASDSIRELARSDARFTEVFSPKRIRLGFSDRVEMSRWQKEIESAKISMRR